MSVAVLAPAPESIFEIGKRLTELLMQAEADSDGDGLADSARERIANVLEALRARVVQRPERDPRSLFDLDEELIDLMDRLEDATAESGEAPGELFEEINDYLEAFRTKVDRIAGYWRWQESIADICAREAERLQARSKAAAGRLERLKAMLLAFMLPRGLKNLEGEKASIGAQRNSTASLVVDDPLQIGEGFFETTLRFSKTDLRGLVSQLPECDLRRRMEASIASESWEINGSAVRSALANNSSVSGARLVKGHHVRLR
jgi:hypothetical protein